MRLRKKGERKEDKKDMGLKDSDFLGLQPVLCSSPFPLCKKSQERHFTLESSGIISSKTGTKLYTK